MDLFSEKTLSQRLKLAVILSLPAILENLLVTLVSIVDTAMVGALGAAATTSVALVASPTWVINAVAMGVNSGCSVLVARYIGAKDISSACRGARESTVLGFGMGFAAFVIMWILAPYIPIWMGGEPEVCSQSTIYLRTISLGYPLYYMGLVINGAIRGYGDTSTPMKITAASNLLNIAGNFFLIYESRSINIFGNDIFVYGAGLGVKGAAIATAASTALSGVFALSHLIYSKTDFRINIRDGFRLNGKDMRCVINIGIPTAVERASISMGQVVFIRIVSTLGTIILAAHHIAVNAESICYQPGYGMQSAGTTLTGQAIGAKDEEMAESYAKIVLWFSVAVMTFNAFLMFVFAEPFISFFTPDKEVHANAVMALRLVAFAQPFFGMYIVGTGVLRGLGDANIAVPISVFSMWLIRIPLALIFVKVLNMGLRGAWYVMVIELTLRGIFVLIRVYSGKWKRLYHRTSM